MEIDSGARQTGRLSLRLQSEQLADQLFPLIAECSYQVATRRHKENQGQSPRRGEAQQENSGQLSAVTIPSANSRMHPPRRRSPTVETDWK